MAAMILCVLVMLALCVLKLVKRTDYRRESDYFYENNLDEYGENEAYTSEYTFNTQNKMCGLALFENVNDETFSVEKIVQFYPGHQALDQAFHWGLRWVAGRK